MSEPPISKNSPIEREVELRAKEIFEEYFVKNYPGPDTIIYDPKWHAPKIFRAALYAMSMARRETFRMRHVMAEDQRPSNQSPSESPYSQSDAAAKDPPVAGVGTGPASGFMSGSREQVPSNPPVDRCEHGIPRQYCTAVHAEARRCRLCDELLEASSSSVLCQVCVAGHDAGDNVHHAGRADRCLTCQKARRI